MNRKYRGDKRAFPNAASHSSEEQKKQDRRNIVQKNVGEMMSGGLQSENLAICHVTQRGQGMP